jgi:DNA-binding transcriptional MerR regulator
MHEDHGEGQHYRIGAVAKLTGISVDRLRAWERRYGAVVTRRTEAHGRIYTRDDVERLTLIKQLVDLGNPISSVAELSDEQLRERLRQDQGALRRAEPSVVPVRVAVHGTLLTAMLAEGADDLPGVRIVARHRNHADFERDLVGLGADVIALEYPGVHEDTVDEVRDLLARSGARRAVLVCGFGRHEVFAELSAVGAVVLRSPVSLDEFALACRLETPDAAAQEVPPALRTELGEAIPPRRFTDADLVRLAGVSRAVECECPEHLVTLIGSLMAFERYSATCEHRNEEDAALHAYLHRVTAHARALIEEALENVIEVEGLG